jgi:hypothetical protein
MGEAMMRMLLGIVGLMCIVGGTVSTLLMVYYFFVMHGNVKPKAKPFIPFTGPFQLFIPQLWNEQGNSARMKLIVSLCFMVFFILTALLIKAVA